MPRRAGRRLHADTLLGSTAGIIDVTPTVLDAPSAPSMGEIGTSRSCASLLPLIYDDALTPFSFSHTSSFLPLSHLNALMKSARMLSSHGSPGHPARFVALRPPRTLTQRASLLSASCGECRPSCGRRSCAPPPNGDGPLSLNCFILRWSSPELPGSPQLPSKSRGQATMENAPPHSHPSVVRRRRRGDSEQQAKNSARATESERAASRAKQGQRAGPHFAAWPLG
jgi:hypothetical protein